MENIAIKLCEITTRKLFIGLEGEQNHVQVVFDASSILNEYPDATVALSVKPPVGEIYPKAVTKHGMNVLWVVSASDCANDGEGEYQITFTNGEEIIKSFIGSFVVFNSLIGNGTAPKPVDEWLQAAQEALGELEDLSASAEGLAAGSEPTAEVTQVGGHKNIAFGIPAGQPGQDGYSPTIAVTDITGGHRVTVTDQTGSASFDVMDGQNGTPGTPGADGYSPTVTVTNITGGHTVTITDKTGDHSFNVMDGVDGKDGTDGYSPSASVSKSGNTVTISITDNTGTTTATITESDPTSIIDDTAGEGSTDKVWSAAKTDEEVSGIKSALNTITPSEYDATATYAVGDLCWHENKMYRCNTAISTAEAWTAAHWTEIAFPRDVRVNGTTVVDANGVANVPLATDTNPGVAKVNSSYGIKIEDGLLKMAGASQSDAKTGTSGVKPITPYAQHAAAFYGLAKASGDTTQSSSSNAVGVYTEDAKSKISDMLNAPVSVSGSTPSITTKSGVRYICGECATLTITVPASGCIDVVFESGSTATVLTVTPTKSGVSAVKWANGFDPTALDANTVYEVNILDGEYGVVASWT